MNMQAQNYLAAVRDQYEDYPYPKRDPADETTRLVMTSTARMDKLVMDGFGGRLDMRQPFRVLVAGGGTGDGAIYFAEQLKSFSTAEIVYLDISSASMAIAKERAQVRGLSNITFVQNSILELAQEGLGQFDVIECCGVLHHLADPDAGLRALSQVLKPEGVISVMLYATYGRTGIYMVQDAMRLFAPQAQSKQEQVERCRRLLKAIHPRNTLITQAVKSAAQEIVSNDDIGVYDLFLHPQDRSYTVPQIYSFAKQAELEVLQFSANYAEGGRMIYNIGNYVTDPALLEDVLQLPLPQQQAMAELLHGGMARHMFLLGRKRPQPIDLYQPEVIPSINRAVPKDTWERLLQFIFNSRSTFAIDLPPHGHKCNVPMTPNLVPLLKKIDGEHSFGEIYAAVNANVPPETMAKEWMPLLTLFSQLDLLYFRYSGTPAFRTQK